VIVEGPEDEAQIREREERERAEREQQEEGEAAPPPVKPFKVCQQYHCSIWHVELKNPSYFYKLNSTNHLTSWWEPGTQVHSSWYYPWYYAPELNVEGNGCGFVGPGRVWSGEHKHLTTWGRYTISATGFTPEGGSITETNHLALQIWVWPNGYQQREVRHWTPDVEVEEA
jgi:hypothetical protein